MYKKYFAEKKSVFFDLDGTIIDSIPYWESACRLVLEEVGEVDIDFSDIYRGSHLEKFWADTVKTYGLKTELPISELVKRTREKYLNIYKETPLEPRDGFWNLVDELKNIKKWPLALLSNSDRSVAELIIKDLNIREGVFDLIITGDEVKHRKPAPDIYEKALKILKLKGREVLAFEDSLSGAKAAQKAGIDVIAIWEGDVPEPEYPKNVIMFLPDFSSIPGNMDTTFMEHAQNSLKMLQSEFSQ